MTNKNGLQLLQPFIEQAEKDKDPYLLAHFSGIDDHYQVYHEGLDKMDAMLVIKGLAKHFDINLQALSLIPL